MIYYTVSFAVLALCASVLTLTGVAIDRVYAVLMPLRARQSAPRPTRVLLVVWIMSLGVAVPFYFMKRLEYDQVYKKLLYKEA